MKRKIILIKSFCLIVAMGIGFGQPSAEKEELVLHFGYGSNMSESYMRQYTRV